MVKAPFSIRQDSERHKEFFALKTDISDGLRPALREWAMKMYMDSHHGTFHGGYGINLRKLTKLELLTGQQINPDGLRSSESMFSDALTNDRALLLDAVDVALGWAKEADAGFLEHTLMVARSGYRVGRDESGGYELQLRQSQEMTRLIETEANQPGRAAEHLRTAWSRCFGRDPDPKGACREAVEAVEVAAKPVVSPRNARTTLGTLCRDMKADLSKWETDFDFEGSVEIVLGMMEMIWNRGHNRHGDASAPLDVPQEAAEMMVQTAVLLVGWFRSGRIRLKP